MMPKFVRPVVVMIPGEGRIPLEEYKYESGGNDAAGFAKNYLRRLTDPVTPGDDLTLIATADWELGKTLDITRLLQEYDWRTPLIDGVQADGGSQMDFSYVLTVSVLDVDEAVLGVCGVLSIIRAATTYTDVKTPVWLDPTYQIDTSILATTTGNLEAKAFGFLFYSVWSGTVTTDIPGVLPPPNPDFQQLLPRTLTQGGAVV